MAQRTRDQAPPPADWLGFIGVVLVLVGALLVAVRLAWLAWQTWAWWSGLVFIALGIGLFLLAAVATWLYTTGIPDARGRWADWQRERERRQREREQEQQEREAAQEGGD